MTGDRGVAQVEGVRCVHAHNKSASVRARLENGGALADSTPRHRKEPRKITPRIKTVVVEVEPHGTDKSTTSTGNRGIPESFAGVLEDRPVRKTEVKTIQSIVWYVVLMANPGVSRRDRTSWNTSACTASTGTRALTDTCSVGYGFPCPRPRPAALPAARALRPRPRIGGRRRVAYCVARSGSSWSCRTRIRA